MVKKPAPPKKKLPTDTNQRAASIVAQITEDEPEADPTEDLTKEQISQLMKAMGRKGGLKGGAARKDALTEKKRIEIAKKAAAARWGKK